LLALLALVAPAAPVLAAAAACGVPMISADGDTAASMQEFLDRLIVPRMATDHVAGAVVSVVKDGRVLLAKGYGWADVARRTPVDSETTLFRVASVSKLFAATAVLQQYERGRLDLDTDIRQWVDFDLQRVSPLPITLRNLLTHTAGFEEGAFGMSENRPEDALTLGDTLRRTMPRQVRPPGVGTSYSNHGVSLAGYVVERTSGMPFATYAAQNILRPLAMTHSTFADPLPPALASHLALPYQFDGGVFQERAAQIVSGLAPAGALSASATDMAHFMIAQLDAGSYEGRSVLAPASLAEMQREQFSVSPTHASSVGLVYSRTFRNGRLILSHGGDLRDYVSALVLLPDARTGIFASFSSASAGPLVNLVPAAFIDRYAGTECRVAPAAPGRDPQEYVGAYRLSRAVESNFAKVAYLFIEFPVSAVTGGDLQFDGGKFTPIGGGRFAQTAAGPSGRQWGTLEFFDTGGVRQIAFSENPFVSAHRLRFVESSRFTLGALAIAAGFLLVTGGRTLWLSIRRQPTAPLVRRQRAYAALALVLVFAFWAGLFGYLFASGLLDTGFGTSLPLPLKALLVLPWLAVAAAVVSASTTLTLLRAGVGSFTDRAFAVLFVPLIALLLGLMGYWHLFGAP